ncbi:hypothetical protein RJJ65_30330 [Rhizobium hidalgonense]|uniref:Uncharacterized protein n=1 Tax=Rhizobium hidalgonense TaxID=1538159 RepID=A0AAJ2H0I6_9HYPH|nr:hypothetical protein [Rhizobium hidalgonense]MDR9776877.1 hypothetical protein [Rhizobium hidalgonense]
MVRTRRRQDERNIELPKLRRYGAHSCPAEMDVEDGDVRELLLQQIESVLVG